MKKFGEIFEKYSIFFLLPLVAIYLYTRIDYLGETSYYLHIDELEAAYESMCIANVGTDSLSDIPSLFFRGLGEGHNALLIYAGALLFKLRGGLFSLKLFRLISVFGGLFSMIFSYLAASEITGSKKYAYLEAVLVTSLPVFFITQRTGVEDYLFLEIVPAAIFFMLIGVRHKRKLYFVLSSVLWILCLLSSESSYFIVPAFVVLSVIYLFLIKEIDIPKALVLCVPCAAIFLLLIITGCGSTHMGISNIIPNIINIKKLFWNDLHPYNSAPMFGSIYIFSVPVLIIGIIASIRNAIISVRSRSYSVYVILWIFIICALIGDLATADADIQTGCSLFFAISLLITEGLAYISENLKWSYVVEIVLYLSMLWIFSYFYYVNHNSAVNNSTDHELGIVVDKSAGEAVKTTIRLLPDRDMNIMCDDFEGRDLLIALYASASPSDYINAKGLGSYSYDKVRVNYDDVIDESGNTVYIINDAEHRDVIDALTSQGWANIYMKEYTICYK